MRFKMSLAAVAVMVALIVPVEPANAARGFAFRLGPHFHQTGVHLVVRATWHADHADPRCPAEDRFDSYADEAHICNGALADIGIVVGQFFLQRGMDSGAVPQNDYSDDVLGACVEEREAGVGTDWWQAYWRQRIEHRPDHHDVDPHAPEYIEQDLRFTDVVPLPRCNNFRWTRNARVV